MRHTTIFAGTIILVAATTVLGATAAQVQYIANEGFLIEAGDKKVLIDSLFDDRSITYCHIPDDDTLREMEHAESPFDGVSLILVTHHHRDHFSAGSVLRRLRNESDSIVVGPPQMVRDLKEAGATENELETRVIEVDLGLFESKEFEVSGIGIQATRLHHSSYLVEDPETGKKIDRHRNIENLIYLVDVAGVKFLHVGDATLDQNAELFEKGLFEKEKLDIVFLEYFDWSEETKAILDRWMKPDQTVFMHLPPQAEQIEAISQRLEFTFPNRVVFDTPLEVKTF